jgi:hypothetical protein
MVHGAAPALRQAALRAIGAPATEGLGEADQDHRERGGADVGVGAQQGHDAGDVAAQLGRSAAELFADPMYEPRGPGRPSSAATSSQGMVPDRSPRATWASSWRISASRSGGLGGGEIGLVESLMRAAYPWLRRATGQRVKVRSAGSRGLEHAAQQHSDLPRRSRPRRTRRPPGHGPNTAQAPPSRAAPDAVDQVAPARSPPPSCT